MAATTPSPADEPKVLTIRKYPNRRYYDSTRSQHVTLEEIHALIRDGYEIHVTDSKTGEDITAKVLAQILLELDPPKLGVFPVALLHRLIRANEQLVQDFTEKYFSRALNAFLDSRRQFEAYLRQSLGLGGTSPTPPDWARMMLGPFARPFWAGGSRDDKRPDATASSSDEGEEEKDLRPVVEELRRQVAGLQKKLAKRRK